MKLIDVEWNIVASIISRPNRFLAIVNIDGRNEKAHVRDPGRLEELIYPGNKVLLAHRPGEGRKTHWEVIAANDSDWILINSGFHRSISEAILGNPEICPVGTVDKIWPEVMVGHSRLDFMVEKDGEIIGLEVKGCTLENNGVAIFPDAPTERGTRHVNALMQMKREGKRAAIMILVFRKGAECFAPNRETDSKFTEAFENAMEIGVEVYPVKLEFKDKSINYLGRIPVCREF